jgi:hypothetical protein
MVDDKAESPTERTPKGLEVPVQKCKDFLGNPKKAAKPEKQSAQGK